MQSCSIDALMLFSFLFIYFIDLNVEWKKYTEEKKENHVKTAEHMNEENTKQKRRNLFIFIHKT